MSSHNLLTLPAELRFQIYEWLLPAQLVDDPKQSYYDTFDYALLNVDLGIDGECPLKGSNLPTPDRYRHFFLTCKQIYHEFEVEWCIAINKLFTTLTRGTPLTPLSITKYSDLAHVSFQLTHKALPHPASMTQRRYYATAMHLFLRFTSSIVVTPDNTFPPHDGTVSGFFLSPQYVQLQVIEFNTHFPGDIDSRIDYWDSALHIVPWRTPSLNVRQNPGEPCGYDIAMKIGPNGTLEALREFRKDLAENEVVDREFRCVFLAGIEM